MQKHLVFSFVAVVTLVTIVPPARGEWLNGVARWLGVGWSDGFHSRTTCPPKHGGVWMPAAETPGVPWWTVPAQPIETLPHPAAPRPDSSRSTYPTGPSLLRQPGDSPLAPASATGGR